MPADALSSAPSAPTATIAPGPVGAFRLLAAFRREQADPDSFYSLLARDSVALVARHIQLSGSQVVDVGGGAGYFADAFRARRPDDHKCADKRPGNRMITPPY